MYLDHNYKRDRRRSRRRVYFLNSAVHSLIKKLYNHCHNNPSKEGFFINKIISDALFLLL